MLASKEEHYKVMLEGEREIEKLGDAAEWLARGDVPESIAAALSLGRLTALRKPNVRGRGVVTGDMFRRLMAATLAQQFGSEMERACEPFQFALPTRAGADSLGLLLRAATDADPLATDTAIDGIGAHGYIHRASMLRELKTAGAASAELPFVRWLCGRRSTYLWLDAEGRQHEVHQGEAGGTRRPSHALPCTRWANIAL